MVDNHNVHSTMERYQLCCCCLELVCLKSLWREYAWMGRIEVYGDMLKECFNLSWEPKDETKDQICEVCITRIRNAVQFKRKVMECQSTLRLQLEDGMRPLKEELLEIEDHKKDEFEAEIVMKIEPEEDYDNQADIVFNDDYENEIINNGESHKHVSFKNSLTVETRSIKEHSKIKDGVVKDPPKRNMVKRMITETKKKNIKSARKSQDKVEKKTINYNPRQNGALILEHSTIVPFKSRVGYFNCFYCNKQFAGFDLLKTHVTELHENISYKFILKSIYRPHDRIRADVSDINCRICKKKMDDLEFLIHHLTDDHNVKFNFDSDTKKPADCILGYDLSEARYRCCQCKEEFTFFKTLSNHMNEHSTDHVCDVCGRCFLVAERLRAHSQLHKEKSVVKCDLCGKICGSKMLLQSHVRYKHKKLAYMCTICDKPFNTSQKRVKHLEEVHNRAPLDLTCKICSKKFGHHRNLYRHMKFHLNIKPERKFGCSVCSMKFSTNSGLSNHMVVHSGEKNYECEFCHKKYGRRKTLMEHLRIHKNDRRFACGACPQAFVQKCSLKNHIRVHHGVLDYEKLIVDKKLDAK